MAIQEAFMNKYTSLGSDTDLELEADTGESFQVQDLFVNNPANNYLQLLIDKVSVGVFRVGGSLGNHLAFPQGLANHTHPVRINQGTVLSGGTSDVAAVDAFGNDMTIAYGHTTDSGANTYDSGVDNVPNTAVPETLVNLLNRRGLNFKYPIGEGQKLTIKEYGSSTQTADVLVKYSQHDSGDMTPGMINGTKSDHYFYINYGDTGGSVAAAGDNLIDTIQIPAEFVDFPIGKDVPSGIRVELHGILASPAIDWDASNDYTQTTYLKLSKEREVLFDEDRNGLLNKGTVPSNTAVGQYIGRGISVLGNYSTIDSKAPFMLDNPLVFNSGEELNVYLTTAEGSGNQGSITQEATNVGFIMEVIPE